MGCERVWNLPKQHQGKGTRLASLSIVAMPGSWLQGRLQTRSGYMSISEIMVGCPSLFAEGQKQLDA
jgi:hypothetical protein